MLSSELKSMLDKLNRDLIHDAKTFLKAHPVYKEGKVGPTAIRNILDVAMTASCREEIEAFIEYQVGKDYKKWDNEGFGSELIKKFGNSFMSPQIASLKLQNSASQLDDVTTELAARWLGYLYRFFRFCEAEQKHSNKKSS